MLRFIMSLLVLIALFSACGSESDPSAPSQPAATAAGGNSDVSASPDVSDEPDVSEQPDVSNADASSPSGRALGFIQALKALNIALVNEYADLGSAEWDCPLAGINGGECAVFTLGECFQYQSDNTFDLSECRPSENTGFAISD
jgi:hypothetical protein